MSACAVATAMAALLAVALASGCDSGTPDTGSSSSTAPGGGRALRPYEVVQSSAERLIATGTARVRSESRTQVGQQRFDVTGTGTADFRAPAFDTTLDVPLLGSARAVGIVNVIYLQSDRISQELRGNPKWLLLDPVRLQASGSMAGEASNPFVRFARSTGDPLPQLALVKGARADTRVVGPDSVDGQPATHYTTELEVALARRYTADPKVLADLDRYTQTVHADSLPAEVWVDPQGRLVRLELVFSTIFREPGTDSTLSFSALGEPIGPIAAPPGDQVTPLEAVIPG